MAEQGLVEMRTVDVNRESTAVVVLTRAGKRVLDAHRTPGDGPAQQFHAGLVKPREIAHDAQLYRLYQAEADRLEAEGGRVTRVVLDYELKRDYQTFLNRPNRPGDPPVAHFVALVTDTTGRGFEQFLQDHAALLRRLPAWAVIAVGSDASLRFADCDAVFARLLASPWWTLGSHLDDLRWYCTTRRAVEGGEFTQLSVPDIDRFRALRERFGAAAFEALYRRWTVHGDEVLAAQTGAVRQEGAGVGRLITEALPFDYSQFGSLPGVA